MIISYITLFAVLVGIILLTFLIMREAKIIYPSYMSKFTVYTFETHKDCENNAFIHNKFSYPRKQDCLLKGLNLDHLKLIIEGGSHKDDTMCMIIDTHSLEVASIGIREFEAPKGGYSAIEDPCPQEKVFKWVWRGHGYIED